MAAWLAGVCLVSKLPPKTLTTCDSHYIVVENTQVGGEHTCNAKLMMADALGGFASIGQIRTEPLPSTYGDAEVSTKFTARL